MIFTPNLVISLILCILAVLSAIGAFLMFGYLYFTESKAPSFSDSLKDLKFAKEQPFVSVIITARNEEQTIGKCLESLQRQSYSNFEIVVVDDTSTDNTALVVEEFKRNNPKVSLVPVGKKPPGWVGKNWPCWRGYEASKGELLLFMDADSLLESDTLKSCVNCIIEANYDIFSIAPRVTLKGVWTHSVMPLISGAINLLYPMIKVNDPKSKRAYVFGTFILVRRSVYEQVGGHSAVKERLVEDAAIASLIKSSGGKLRIERGSEFAHTEWEQNLTSIYNGLERIISSSIRYYGLVSLFDAILLFFVIVYPIVISIGFVYMMLANLSGIFQPLISLTTLFSSLLTIILLLMLAWTQLKMTTGEAGAWVFLYPVGGVIFITAIVTTSIKVARGKGIEWKGQLYVQPMAREK